MTFSIVTISFNQGAFLERAIRSVLDQKGVDVQYIVVDPGSTDGSRDIIERYRDQIDLIIYDKDDGPADGLNRGLAASTGEFFGYINADDAFVPGALAEAAAFLKAHPEIDVVCGNGHFIDEQDRKLKHLISSRKMDADRYARGSVFIFQQGAFHRTEPLRAIGGFNVENRTSWDGEAYLDLAREGRQFKRVWRDWGLFRLHCDSMTGSGKAHQRYLADCERMFVRQFARPRNRWDRVRAQIERVTTLISDPRRLLVRLGDRFGARSI
ncbi:MAG: glycosyltransferase family 2 protein [Novosphingobium sp.]